MTYIYEAVALRDHPHQDRGTKTTVNLTIVAPNHESFQEQATKILPAGDPEWTFNIISIESAEIEDN